MDKACFEKTAQKWKQWLIFGWIWLFTGTIKLQTLSNTCSLHVQRYDTVSELYLTWWWVRLDWVQYTYIYIYIYIDTYICVRMCACVSVCVSWVVCHLTLKRYGPTTNTISKTLGKNNPWWFDILLKSIKQSTKLIFILFHFHFRLKGGNSD